MGTQHAAVRRQDRTASRRSSSSRRSGSATLRRALAAPIQLGPLPDGVHLTGIALRTGRATIAGGGDARRIRA